MAPFLKADHIGSLIRPTSLTDARAALGIARDSLDTDSIKQATNQLKAVEKSTVKDVLLNQLEHGITPITSGEFERSIFFEGFLDALDGIETHFTEWSLFRKDHPIMIAGKSIGWKGMPIAVATNKITWSHSAYMEDWLYVQSVLPEQHWSQVKMTLPSPNWTHELVASNAFTKDAYVSDEEYLMDAARAFRAEIMALYDAGVHSSLQGEIFPKVDTYRKGAYDPISARLFQDLNFKRYYLEFDDERSGNFEALRYLPAEKVAVLGLVTTKNAELENIEMLKSRVFEAALVIAQAQSKSREQALRDNLAVSPQCGFASSAGSTGIDMNEEIQWKKLELVKRLADELWPDELAQATVL